MDTFCQVTCGTCPDEGLNGCDLPSNTIFLDTDGSVIYNSDTAIAGFQFTVEGATIEGASGGDAEDAGLNVSHGPSNALGVSFSGGSIDAGCGTLTELSLDGTPTGLSGILVSDTNAQAISISYYGSGCTDSTACNFDPNAITDDGSCLSNDCLGNCGGSAVVDECGVCDGSGIPAGDCDCNGNVHVCYTHMTEPKILLE